MTKDEALKMAFEALERSVATCFDQRSHDEVMGRPEHFVNRAITAIKEALAQPEQEPVCDKDPQGCWNVRCQLGNKCRNTSLQPKEPEQEPDEGVAMADYMAIVEKYAFLKASAVKAEREVVANWIMDKGFATGHGDSIVDLLDQLEWQIAEKEREERAKLCEEMAVKDNLTNYYKVAANAIRARGQE